MYACASAPNTNMEMVTRIKEKITFFIIVLFVIVNSCSLLQDLVAHQPFAGREHAIREDYDISSYSTFSERMETRQKIRETDTGIELQNRIDDLKLLLSAYHDGVVAEGH